jgi:hypothetical protein
MKRAARQVCARSGILNVANINTARSRSSRRPQSPVEEMTHQASDLLRELQPSLDHLRQKWTRFDGAELGARIAALSLVPDNTPFTARLATAANVASTIPTRRDGVPVPLAFLNEDSFGPASGIGLLDDPYEDWFTDSVPFEGGPYTIFPGREGGRGTLLRLLIRALFFDREIRTTTNRATGSSRRSTTCPSCSRRTASRATTSSRRSKG